MGERQWGNEPSEFQRVRLRVFQDAIPDALTSIDAIVRQTAGRARPLNRFGYTRLASAFPEDVVLSTEVIEVPVVPVPRSLLLALSGLVTRDRLPTDAITFHNVTFVRERQISEGVLFRELVRRVQWQCLGPKAFLLVVAVTAIRFRYARSPLGISVRELGEKFDAGFALDGVAEHIEDVCQGAWSATQRFLAAAA